MEDRVTLQIIRRSFLQAIWRTKRASFVAVLVIHGRRFMTLTEGSSSLAVLPQRLHQPALDYALRRIEPKHARGHLANPRQGFNHRTIQFEVLVPEVPAGIEETDHPPGTINRRDVRSFVPIAKHTSEGQVANARGAAVLPADNMIDLVRKAADLFVHKTVFATAARSLDYPPARRPRSISHSSESAAPALWPSGEYAPSP